MALQKSFRVLEKADHPKNLSIILENRKRNDRLLFESSIVAVLCTREYEQVKKLYKKTVDAYCCLGVLQLNCGEQPIQYLVVVTGCVSVGKINETEIFRITQTQFVNLQSATSPEDRIVEVRKFLNSGTFYFGWGGSSSSPLGAIDITLCAQRRLRTSSTDQRFFWNRMFHCLFVRFGIACDDWLIKVMCGSVEIRTVYVGHRQARAAIFSRLSCERAGTRFNVRGTNDDGHVANFVETEQAIYLDDSVTSYIQTRGSVPLFWEQPGVQVGSHKVKLSRGYEASRAAFHKHMKVLRERYGNIVIVNLLGTSLVGSKEGEASLSNEFQKHHSESEYNNVIPHIVFDYHNECRTSLDKVNNLVEDVKNYNHAVSYFMYHKNGVDTVQRGTVRVNCLDCLDRTNCVQTAVGLAVLEQQLNRLFNLNEIKNAQNMVLRFIEVFKQMWITNGNEVSKIYAGTGAIQGGSKLMDGARSAARTIQNNLLDNAKQEAIDILLFGSALNSELHDKARILLPQYMLHATPNVLSELCHRYKYYTEPSTVTVGIGTYNVNGGKHFRSLAYKGLSIEDWLLMLPTRSGDSPDVQNDIYAIGFQEIVDLNASNIMTASTENVVSWCDELQRVLSSRNDKYALISYQQLVGVCLFVFVKEELTQHIRDVAVDTVKTGLGGATGNKGAVGIRLVLHGTSICFVCAHFAAGQSQVSERNNDYAEITKRLSFPMGRTLNSHEYIFFCGDFNYRIDMDKNCIKDLVKESKFDEILAEDQLKKSQEQGNCFQNFLEGEIKFAPTYKYDLFSDDYDTSEKCRAPAYTDRVLWRRKPFISQSESDVDNLSPGRCLLYNRAELKQSDHRPVISIIEIEINVINETVRESTYYEVLNCMGPPDGTVCLSCEVEDEDQLYESDFVNAVVTELSQIGEIIMVRFNANVILATFKDPLSSLMVVRFGQITVNGIQLKVELKSPNWVQKAKEEMSLCSDNTIPLCEDSEIGFTMPSKPAPPSRPPLPTASPARSVPPIPTENSSLQHDHEEQGLCASTANVHLSQFGEGNNDSVDLPEPMGPPPTLNVTDIQGSGSSVPHRTAPPPPGPRRPDNSPGNDTPRTPPPIPARTRNHPPLPSRPTKPM